MRTPNDIQEGGEGPTRCENSGENAAQTPAPGPASRLSGTATRPSELRHAVDKWLVPDATHPARVACTGRTHAGGVPYVLIQRAADAMAIFFFRHRDGSWQVYPPA